MQTVIMSQPAEPLSVVIVAHNAADRLDRVTAWRASLDKCGRAYELIVVDDGSTDGTTDKLAKREPVARLLRHESRRGYGACLRTALAVVRHPLLFYTALDYPYSPGDLRRLLERIDLRDEVLGQRPDLVSGCRTGLVAPLPLRWAVFAWRLFWRVFAGLPIPEPAPWHGWQAFWYKHRVAWVYGVPLADVNSCFKLYRTAFLKRFPIQSDGDFVHTELVAKATFLTSIIDEVPLTPRPEPIPPADLWTEDRRSVFRRPQFAFPREATPGPTAPRPDAESNRHGSTDAAT